MDYPSIDRLAELQQMIADFAKVTRDNIPLADNKRPENDVEHSFGLALTCWYLQPKIAPELDLSKILRYALAHDIIEIHSGDTYIFDKELVSTKAQREQDALAKIGEEWSDFHELAGFAKSYMEKTDEEAKFVKAIDKILPVIMIDLHEKEKVWVPLKVTLEMQKEHKKTILVSDIAAPYYEKLITWLDERGNIPRS